MSSTSDSARCCELGMLRRTTIPVKWSDKFRDLRLSHCVGHIPVAAGNNLMGVAMSPHTYLRTWTTGKTQSCDRLNFQNKLYRFEEELHTPSIVVRLLNCQFTSKPFVHSYCSGYRDRPSIRLTGRLPHMGTVHVCYPIGSVSVLQCAER